MEEGLILTSCLQIEKQTVGVKENSEALKGITKDSIGENKNLDNYQST